jgi:FkbM family methyltransferase
MKDLVSSLISRWSYLKKHGGFPQAPIRTVFRLIYWKSRCVFRIPITIRLPQWNVYFFLPAYWRGVAKLVFVFRENYEAELTFLDHFLFRGMTFVDAGANFGIYTVVASQLVGDAGRVLAFEPAADTFSVLKHNLDINHLSNVSIFRFALSDREGEGVLYHHGGNPDRYSLGQQRKDLVIGSEKITISTLDKVLREQDIHHVDFLKLDVEGAEELVLRGAESMLKSMRPTIVFEVNLEAAKELVLSGTEAWRFLSDLGYHFFSLTKGGDLVGLELPPHFGNVIAMHRTRLSS